MLIEILMTELLIFVLLKNSLESIYSPSIFFHHQISKSSLTKIFPLNLIVGWTVSELIGTKLYLIFKINIDANKINSKQAPTP